MKRNVKVDRRNFLGKAVCAVLGCAGTVWPWRFGGHLAATEIAKGEGAGKGVYVSRDLQDQWVQRQEYDAFGVVPE